MLFNKHVARGAALLDEKKPEWFLDVEPATLNLRSDVFCVLGQTYGTYWRGERELFGEAFTVEFVDRRDQAAEAHGFILDPHLEVLVGWFWYRRLTAAWKKLIEARKKEHRDNYLYVDES